MGKLPIRFRRPLYLGRDIDNGRPVSLRQEWFKTHLHLIGPPGRGKTRLLLHIFEHLSRDPNATTVLVNAKGALGRMARDLTISQGRTKRLVSFDLSDRQVVTGYNPLWPRDRAVATHAKGVREAFASAWGQSSFDETPQLARFLLLSLAVSIAVQGTLLDTIRLLRSGPVGARVRRVFLAELASGNARGERDLLIFLREMLDWFDSLGERRQEELAASTLARLEAFVCDPVVSRVLTQRNCLDMSKLIAEHKIVIANLEINRPLCLSDVRLLGRFIVNDVLNSVFGRDPSPDEPVYLILDEVEHFATHDLCSILDMGREMGLHCVLAHQNLGQLRREDGSGYVYDSVQGSALTKFYFGGLKAADWRAVIEDASIEQFDRYKVKDELTTVIFKPIESRRTVVTESRNVGISSGAAKGTSRSQSRVDARGFSRSNGRSTTDGESSGSTSSSGFVAGSHSGLGGGETMLPDGEIIETTNEIDGTSESYIDSQTDSYSEMHTRGTHRSKSVQHSRARGRAEGTQEVRSLNISKGMSRSAAENPFYEYEEVERVSSRTYDTEQEYFTDFVKKLMGQPQGHAFLKVPGKPGRFLRLPWVSTPWISEKTRKAGLERVYALPFYSRQNENPPEERLLEDLPPPLIGSKRPSTHALISERSEVIEREEGDENFTSSVAPFKPKKPRRKK